MTEQTTPLVTFGMPVYNGQDYLEEALNSILAQTFTDFELIISDNASTDRTEEICRAYAGRDARIQYVRNPVNLGAARNYNRLVDLARGKYFKWASHDDLIEPDFLERCVAVLEANPDAVLAYTRNMMIDAQGHAVQPYEDRFQLVFNSPAERFKGFFKTPGMCNPVFGLLRLDALQRTARIGAFRASDRILLGHLALLGKFHEVPARLFYRRMHANMSMKANVSDKDIAAWFDPASKRSLLVLFPRWRWVLEYLRDVTRSPMPLADRARCYYYVFRFQVVNRNWWRSEWNTVKHLAGRALSNRESHQPA